MTIATCLGIEMHSLETKLEEARRSFDEALKRLPSEYHYIGGLLDQTIDSATRARKKMCALYTNVMHPDVQSRGRAVTSAVSIVYTGCHIDEVKRLLKVVVQLTEDLNTESQMLRTDRTPP